MVKFPRGIPTPAQRSLSWMILNVLMASYILLAGTGCKSVPESITNIPGIKQIGQATGVTLSDAEQVAAVMEDVERGLEARQIFKVLSHVAGNYHDGEGRTYNSLQVYLQDLFKNYKEIRVTRVTPRITIQGTQAKVVDSFGTVAEPFDPSKHQPINVQGQVAITLVKAGNEWVITEWSALL